MWINKTAISRRDAWRESEFNGTVMIKPNGIAKIVDAFNTFFSNFTDFSNEIASIFYFPLSQDALLTTKEGYLRVGARSMSDVDAAKIDNKASVLCLGSIYIPTKYNNFADYKGYTYIKAFLPFLGYVDVDVNECMGKFLCILLSVDYQTGFATYMLGSSIDEPFSSYSSVFASDHNLERVRIFATYDFTLGVQIPIGKSNFGDIIRNTTLNIVNTAANIGVALLTKSIPTTTSTTSRRNTTTNTTVGDTTYSRKTSSTGYSRTSTRTSSGDDVSKPISKTIDTATDCLNINAPSGNTDRINNSTSLFAMSTNVILVIYRPKIMNFDHRVEKLKGKPVGVTLELSKLGGYTEISDIHLEGSYFEHITTEEMIELKNTLLSPNGIILPGEITELYEFYLSEYTNQQLTNYFTFRCPPYMTWSDFVYSPYNINNYFIENGGFIIRYDGHLVQIDGVDDDLVGTYLVSNAIDYMVAISE